MVRKDQSVYFDRPIGAPLTDNYRGPDRRDEGDAAIGSLTRLLGWPAATVAVVALVWAVPLAAPVGPAVQVALGSAAAGVALVIGRATGQARTLGLGSSAALVAVGGVVLLGEADAAAALAAIVAAGLLGSSWLGPEVDTRLLDLRTWAARVAVAGLGILLVASVEHRTIDDAIAAWVWAAALLAWLAVFTLLLARQRRGNGSRVTPQGLHLAMAGALGATCHASVAIADDPRLDLVGSIVVALGAGFVLVSLVRLLAADLESWRSRQHLDRVLAEHQAGIREAGIREAAHEARNALTGIEAAAWGLRRLPTVPDPRQQAVAAALDNGIARLKALLLPEERHQPGEPAIATVLDPIVWLARGRGTQVVTSGDVDVRVACPPSVLGQALDNLLINAHLHGEAAVRPVAVHVETDDGHVDIVVHDQGPGIPEDLREAMFQRGVRRGDNAGEGLGLSLARELLREHGAELTADRPDRGASFRVRLRRTWAGAEHDRDSAEERDHHHE